MCTCLLAMSQHLRLDKGTETGIMATIHAYLHAQTGDTQAPEKEVTYGPSTNNKVITEHTFFL